MTHGQTHTLHYHQFLAAGLVLFSLLMSALVSRTVFERLPHLEDEMAYLFQAKVFAGGHLVIDSPQPRRAYWQPFVVDYEPTGKRFGKYTPGWPALLAVGVSLGQPWVINAFLAALTVALVYRLGREIFNPDVGLIAAGLTAFSPMALLLNATLMGHTAALFFVTLFMYAYWRMSRRDRYALRWGLAGGLALGIVVITRPLTALGVTAPFIVWSGFRLLAAARSGGFMSILRPLLALSLVTTVLGATIPIFNAAATGNPALNLYTLVWNYDQVGFGECCGRHGHTLEKGVRQTRWDLSLTAADLFGWQIGAITPEVEEHLLTAGDGFPNTGISWILLPFGLILGIKRRWGLAWLLAGLGWLALVDPAIGAEPAMREVYLALWVLLGFGWLMAAAVMITVFKHPQTAAWTWLLLGVVMGLIGVHIAYWIGSQRYSTRYYFETLTAFALLSALPAAWLARRIGRIPVYGLLAVVMVYSLYAYSTPRITPLYRFNLINRDVIEGVRARAQDDQPVLVIVTGERGGVRWRSMGSLMAVTSPYLDSQIIVAWDYAPQDDIVRDQILARFPDRQVIEMGANGNDSWFLDDPAKPNQASG